jgi:hypothetical protein
MKVQLDISEVAASPLIFPVGAELTHPHPEIA